MDNTMRTIAYICPKCKEPVVEEKSEFSLNAAPVQIPCTCGGATLTIENRGAYYRAKVPCAICGEEHVVDCSSRSVWSERGLALACRESSVPCCFIGNPETVHPAANRMLETIQKLEKNKSEGAPFLDELIMYEILSELRDIAARNGISCICGSHSWEMRVNVGSVDLFCKECNSTLRIPAATQEDLDNLCCQMKVQIRK